MAAVRMKPRERATTEPPPPPPSLAADTAETPEPIFADPTVDTPTTNGVQNIRRQVTCHLCSHKSSDVALRTVSVCEWGV